MFAAIQTPDILAAILIAILGLLLLVSFKRNTKLTEQVDILEERVKLVRDEAQEKEKALKQVASDEIREHYALRGKLSQLLFGNTKLRRAVEIINRVIYLDNYHAKHSAVDAGSGDQLQGLPGQEQQSPPAPEVTQAEAGAHSGVGVGSQGVRGGGGGA